VRPTNSIPPNTNRKAIQRTRDDEKKNEEYHDLEHRLSSGSCFCLFDEVKERSKDGSRSKPNPEV